MASAGPGKRVRELVLLRHLVLREEVGRSDKGVQIGEGGLRHAAVERGVYGDTGNVVGGVIQAEGILFRLRLVAGETDAQLVDQAGADHARPADGDLISGQLLLALR